MSITLERAKDLVGWADDNERVWQVREFPLGWCFWVQNRRFIESGAIEDVLLGPGHDFVIASTGNVIRAGSGKPDAEARLLEMAQLNLPLDQSNFDIYMAERRRQDPRFLTQEELVRALEP